jgi:hypothetical protein
MTVAKTSIFSYDFLSIMKKKMKLKKEKLASLNNNQNNSGEGPNPIPEGEKSKQGESKNKEIKNTPDQNPSASMPALPSESRPDLGPKSSHASKDGPVFFTGWVKYFKYEDEVGNKKKPSTFFKNNEFFNQKKLYPGVNIKQRERDGQYEYIAEQSYWFATLYKESLVISTAKKGSTSKVYDVLNLELIIPVFEGREYQGGIIDFGAFSEGYCFKVATVTRTTWIFCTETINDKQTFMVAIKSLKLMNQRVNGDIVLEAKAPKPETLNSIMAISL